MEKALNRIANGIKMVLDKLDHQPIDNVMAELNTDKTFLKVKGNALDIDKVQFSFVEFDKRTKKLTKFVDIYLNIPETLVLCNDLISGRICKLAQAEKSECFKKRGKYPNPVYCTPLGGVSEEKAKERGLRTDGKAISRCFHIAAGAKADFVITAEQRAGHSNNNGIIVPEGNPEVSVRVGISNNDIKGFALTVKAHIEGYIAAKYANNGYARQQKQ